MSVFVLLFWDSSGGHLATRVFSSMPSASDVQEAWVFEQESLEQAEFRVEPKGEDGDLWHVSVYEDGEESEDVWGDIWKEDIHHPSGTMPKAPEEPPTMAEIHLQWQMALRGEDTVLWAPGDPDSPNSGNIGARLTEAEQEKYAPQLALLRRYAFDLDECGDALQSKLRSAFEVNNRERLLERPGWVTSSNLKVLDLWYDLPEAMRDRLVSSFS